MKPDYNKTLINGSMKLIVCSLVYATSIDPRWARYSRIPSYCSIWLVSALKLKENFWLSFRLLNNSVLTNLLIPRHDSSSPVARKCFPKCPYFPKTKIYGKVSFTTRTMNMFYNDMDDVKEENVYMMNMTMMIPWLKVPSSWFQWRYENVELFLEFSTLFMNDDYF